MDFTRTCRCCLIEVTDISDLYEFNTEVAIESPGKEIKFVKLLNCFSLITSIRILRIDEEFSHICGNCVEDLKAAYYFRLRSLENDQVFRKALLKKRSPGDQTITITPDYVISEKKAPAVPKFKQEAKDQVAVVEIKEEAENYIEYIDEEYLDPIYLNEGINQGSMELEDENMGDEEVEDEEEEEEFEDEENPLDEVRPKRSKVPLNDEFAEEEEGKTFYCGFCPKTFDRNSYYRRHFRRVHMTTEVENAKKILKMENRMQEAKDLQVHQCEWCGKIDMIKSKHLEHMALHEGQELYKCKKCDVGFTTRESLKQHVVSHPDMRRYICDICGNSFKNRYALTLHNRSHSGEKPFKCPICERGFSMASNMSKHIESHSDAKPYACEVCGQFCKTPRSLKFHIICFHKTEMKIKCPDCDKSFVNKSYLKMHQQYHTGNKKFTCTICESKYYKSSHLKRHIQHVHFKLRLLKCEFCTSDFVRKETYRTHVLNHHKNIPAEQLTEVLERIKNFKPPALDVDQFTLEKQKFPKRIEEQELIEIAEVMDDNETHETDAEGNIIQTFAISEVHEGEIEDVGEILE